MKLLFVVQRYGAEVTGGSEAHCRLTAIGLAARGYDVSVVTSCASDYLTWANTYPPGVSQDHGVTVHRFRTARERPFTRFWMLTERAMGHKGSALGFCSGIIAGLVAVTPAAGNVGVFGAVVLGAIASVICYFAVAKLKPALGYDDSLDAFGIHGIGGMIGAIGTGILHDPSLGGPGDGSVTMGAQTWVQLQTVLTTIVWAAVGTAIAIFIATLLTGLRVKSEVEQEGLDIGEHCERAYN